jgi:Holliday junction resolvase RusA-like endonuclease
MNGNGPRKPPSGGRIALAMDAFPPDRRRRDIDNIQKATLDALEHAGVYQDDSLIDMLFTRRCEVVPGGKVHIQIEPLPLNRCLLCGHFLTQDELEHPHDN